MLEGCYVETEDIFQSPFLGASLFYVDEHNTFTAKAVILSISIFRSFSLLLESSKLLLRDVVILSISIFRSFSLLRGVIVICAKNFDNQGFQSPFLGASLFYLFSRNTLYFHLLFFQSPFLGASLFYDKMKIRAISGSYHFQSPFLGASLFYLIMLN